MSSSHEDNNKLVLGLGRQYAKVIKYMCEAYYSSKRTNEIKERELHTPGVQ